MAILKSLSVFYVYGIGCLVVFLEPYLRQLPREELCKRWWRGSSEGL